MEVAIKEANSESAMEEMIEEAKAMIRVSKHDHIVNFQGISVDNHRIVILLEFCSFGSIDNFLRKHTANFRTKLENQSFREIITWCSQVADAMEFLVKHDTHCEFLLRNGIGKTCLWKKHILVFFDS